MNARTVEILLEIMTDNELVTRRRIQAAEAILGFEASTDAVNRARAYLAQVSEDKENEQISDRMDALEISRKFEAKKIAPQTVHLTRREETDRKWRGANMRWVNLR
jgi:LPS O-antigen subunit length determinant protein (WzzB/FepE family)